MSIQLSNAKRDVQINKHIDLLSLEISNLEEKLVGLNERLAPVLNCSQKNLTEEVKEEENRLRLCPLAEDIYNTSLRLRLLTDLVKDIILSLEI